MNTNKVYKESLKSCVESDKITQVLSNIDLSREDLYQLLIPKEEELVKGVNNEIDEIELIEKQLENAIDKRRLLVRKRLPFQIVSIRLFWSLIILISLLIVSSGVWLIWKPQFLNFAYEFAINLNSNLIIIFLISSAIIVVTYFVYRYLKVKQIELFDLAEKENESGRENLESKKNIYIDRLKNKLENKIITPEIILICNKLKEDSYSNKFDLISINSLSSDYSSKYEVLTKNKNDLTNLLEKVQSGTIGISGPRGIGKSLMLKTFYSSTERVINNKKVLPIISSAPLRYETREFTTHLFSKVIDEYLMKEEGRPIDNSRLMKPRTSDRSIDLWISRISRLSILIGMILISINILLAIINPKIEDTKQNIEQVKIKEYTLSNLDFYNQFKFGIYGIILLTAAFYAQFDIIARRRKIREYELEKEYDYYGKRENSKAYNWKEKLKYQMSYTSGWSGAIKSSIGLEAGINSSISMAENQLSLPEIVEGFKSFINEIQDEYKVVIAIDELDKIHNATDLNLFLNEIKALFEVENCIFLITISEEASNSFINREISTKNVLDSSFDEIIKLDYLDFDQTKELIQKRVLGLPIPFITFIYLYSGGLPREIIRLLRCVTSYVSQNETIDLESIIENICVSDIKSKIHSLFENNKLISSVYLKPTFQNLFITKQLNHIKWNDLDSVLIDLEQLCGEFENDEQKLTIYRLISYITFIYKIGKLIKKDFDFKANLAQNAQEIENLSFLYKTINNNPIYTIDKLNDKNWCQHFV